MEVHQRGSASDAVRCRLDHGAAAVEQVRADVDEEGGEHGLLAGEVPVDGGSAHAGGRSEVLDRDAGEAALGEQGGGGRQQGAATVGLRLAPAAVGTVRRGRVIGRGVPFQLMTR